MLPPDLVDLGTSVLHDAVGYGALPTGLRPLSQSMRCAGPAFPVICRDGDNLALHEAVAAAPEGSVIVAEAFGVTECAFFGGLMCAVALRRGLGALVINGVVRDSMEIIAGGFPVFAIGASPRGPRRAIPAGSFPDSVRMGGVDVHLGDLVVGDADGIVAIRRHDLPRAIEASRGKLSREARFMELISQGLSTIDGFRDAEGR